jgi:hypothetical protein
MTGMTEMADKTPRATLAEARTLTHELRALADVAEPPSIAQGALARLTPRHSSATSPRSLGGASFRRRSMTPRSRTMSWISFRAPGVAPCGTTCVASRNSSAPS